MKKILIALITLPILYALFVYAAEYFDPQWKKYFNEIYNDRRNGLN